MFREEIENGIPFTPLTMPAEINEKLTGNSYIDYTFPVLFNLFLANHIPEGKVLFASHNCSRTFIRNYIQNAEENGEPSHNVYCGFLLADNGVTNYDMGEYLKEHGFEESKVLHEFYSGSNINSHVYINMEMRTTIIISPAATVEHWHFQLSPLSRLFPYLIDPKKTTREEIQFLSTMTPQTSDCGLPGNYNEFKKYIEQKYEESGYEDIMITNKLSKLQETINTARIAGLNKEIAYIEDRIEKILAEYSDLLTEARTKKKELSFEKYIKDTNGDVELVEVFKSLKNKIKLISVTDSIVIYRVFTELNTYDPAKFASVIKVSNNYERTLDHLKDEMDAREKHYSVDQIRSCLLKVFSGKKYVKMRCFADFAMDLRTNSTRPIDFTSNRETFKNDSIQNPHCMYHKCLGDWKKRGIEYMKNGQYSDAVTSTMAGAGNIDFNDISATEFFTGLPEWIDQKFFNKSGRLLSLAEVIEEYVLEQEEENA